MGVHQVSGTVAAIMTSDLFEWNTTEPREVVIETARRNEYDYVPIRRDGKAVGLINVELDADEPLTLDRLVARDTSIAAVVSLLANGGKHGLFVVDAQDVCGVVTPADLNKITARSYYYAELAALETTLADRALDHYKENPAAIFELARPPAKSVDAFRKEVNGRGAVEKRADLALDPIRLLFLSDLIRLLKADPSFLASTQISDAPEVDRLFDGINDLRNAVMHTNNPVLANRSEVRELHDKLTRIGAIIHLLQPRVGVALE